MNFRYKAYYMTIMYSGKINTFKNTCDSLIWGSNMRGEDTIEYPSLLSLSREIVIAKLQQAILERSGLRPFFRENQKNGKLEFVIPINCLSMLEKCVLDELNYPKKSVRIENRFVKAFVIILEYIQKSDPELAEEMVKAYNKLLK